ncbi:MULTISPECIES: DNA-processing protein DprA [Comamonas]|uniref:DNA-processing protein DprA n=1 Tax=Comamonas squillarum TaxID=2977320 RepID=A0ABY5ZUD3_9BURK|nr:DNA-processing protein DprA [Comamonas sp. PR12]UXC17592.1 DNA-processing protein DprA [Comamonas sp. PR12]
MTEQELHDWLRLSATPGLGNTTIRRLLARFGLPADVLAQTSAALESCITPAQARALHHPSPELQALQAATWAWLTSAPTPLQRHVLTLGDADYPASLLETADPPVLLYITGHARWFGAQGLAWPHRALAVVGSRNPTPQGALHARAFAQTLARQGVTVVSGLALGIDAAAHAGALEAATDTQPATIAVIGTGIDRVYPRANHPLAAQISEQGWIVSEYHLGTPPLAQNFPKRNRLIAGLASGTLVVEAATASGSLVTARLASEQGREVFAIPGSIHAPQSKGCHALIRQGAKLVESVEDILEELPALGGAAARAPAAEPAPAAAPGAAASNDQHEDQGLLQALGFDPVDLDSLCSRTGIDIASLQIQLLELELQGQVARLPGGLFQRLAAG